MKHELRVWADGAKSAVAWTTSDGAKRVVLVPDDTGNYNEYRAVSLALDYCLVHGATHLIVFSDSELVVRQLRREYNVRSPRLQALWQQVKAKEAQFESVEYRWIPREENPAGKLLG